MMESNKPDEVQVKSISVEKGAQAEEVRVTRKYISAALINHTFNVFFVTTLAAYIFLMFGALKYYKLVYALGLMGFMSPYFITMLYVLPILKGSYIKKYGTLALDTDVTPAGKI